MKKRNLMAAEQCEIKKVILLLKMLIVCNLYPTDTGWETLMSDEKMEKTRFSVFFHHRTCPC